LLALTELEPLLDEMPDELESFERPVEVLLESLELPVSVVLVVVPLVPESVVVVPAELASAPASLTPTIRPMVRATLAAAIPAPAYPARFNSPLGVFGSLMATTLASRALRRSQPSIKPVLRNAGNGSSEQP
jgi:hypothetical protein